MESLLVTEKSKDFMAEKKEKDKLFTTTSPDFILINAGWVWRATSQMF